jgi:signal transduction histidine kinase
VNYQAYPILYVDDDRANLESFQYLLADRFRILTADHSDQALGLLQSEGVAVLLADQRMEKGLSGVELCAVARERFPDVVRMIVTAYADIPTLAAGINDGQISRYIAKPWSEEGMVSTLQMAIDAHHLGAFTRELQVSLLKSEQLSTSSFVVSKLLHDLCNPATALHDNLGYSLDLMPTVGAALGDAPGPARRCFDETEAALKDAAEAARMLAARIGRFRNGEAAALPTSGVTSLARVVEATIAIVGAEARKRATLVLDLDAKPEVAADPTQASQIVLGLLMSVLESIPVAPPAPSQIRISTFTTDRGGGVAIEHSGAGVPERADEDPFEPFQEQPGARARGLGLAVVRELVRAARGHIQVRHLGERTQLVVELPLA